MPTQAWGSAMPASHRTHQSYRGQPAWGTRMFALKDLHLLQGEWQVAISLFIQAPDEVLGIRQ